MGLYRDLNGESIRHCCEDGSNVGRLASVMDLDQPKVPPPTHTQQPFLAHPCHLLFNFQLFIFDQKVTNKSQDLAFLIKIF